MEFLRRFIEQKLAAVTGAAVRLGKFSFSPLSGAIEVHDLEIGSLLTVKRVEAKIAVGRAIKNQEIVVRSLAIEGPQVTLIRHDAGAWNLPPRKRSALAAADEPAKKWEFEAHKILLVGGRIEFRDDSTGYRASLENLTGSVEWDPSAATGIEFVFAADSLGRRDKSVELGRAKLLGSLSDWAARAMELTLTAGSMLTLTLRTPQFSTKQWDIKLGVSGDVATLIDLLPPTIRLPIASANGNMQLSLASTISFAGKSS